MRALRSILDGPDSISRNTDNELIGEIIKKWAITEGGLRQKDFDRGYIEYDSNTHTIVFNPEIATRNAAFFPTIEDITKTSPNLIWTVNDKTIYKPLIEDLYSMGITVNDIHIRMPNELDTLYYIGDFSEPKECADARNITRATSFGLVGFSVGDLVKDYKFDFKNLNNLKYILPNLFVLYFTVPYIELTDKVKGLNAWTLNTYNIKRYNQKCGLVLGGLEIFKSNAHYRPGDKTVVINPEIDETLLLKYICEFAKNNPNIGLIHTITNGGHSVDLKIQETFGNKKIIYTCK